ncbi:MAG: Na/Pi symporter [Cyclobacteriaceae bacterium]|nr:Na/Pi symporter [Cyclobacteriaceae bacterium]
METPLQHSNVPASRPPLLGRVITTLYILGTLVLFVFSLDLLVSSLQNLGKSAAETIIMATSNPFTALFIGLLITAMIQSSSTTTALVVAFVASGSITLESAIPIIMGANIGTTITSTIVSLGFINKKKEFRRAVAAGTYHDFFNILTVFLLFPLEYYFRFLSDTSLYITQRFLNLPLIQAESIPTGWSGFTPVVDFFIRIIPSGFVLAVLSFGLLFLSIVLFRQLISRLLMASSPERFSRFFFKNTWKSFFWGLLTTAAIRSSTITTSVVVPIVAQKIITLRKAAPFILGANIGTTITAFIAATLNVNSSSAISIALVHFLINFFGVLVFYPIPFLRQIPLGLAYRLGRLTLRYRLVGFVYILTVFFFIPFSLIYLNKDSAETIRMGFRLTNHKTAEQKTIAVTLKQPSGNKSGEWLMYRSADNAPEEIIVIYRRNNMLMINKEMFLFNKPGYCWDGENKLGKYECCVEAILPSFSTASNLTFDSVYVFNRQYYQAPDSAIQRLYISRDYPAILKYTSQTGNRITETEEVVSISQE